MIRSGAKLKSARAVLRALTIAAVLLYGGPVSAASADQTPAPTVDLSQLSGPVADQVRSVLNKARTFARAPGFQKMAAYGSHAPNDLSVPILTASPRSQVAAGDKIRLPWVGGFGGYQARLLSGATQPLATLQVPSAQAVFASDAIGPGTYTVQITDSGGTMATGAFEVVQDGPALNPDPIEPYRGRVPPSVFAIAKASLFAKQGHEFYLQAYQLLAPYENYPQVADLKQILTQGVSVK